MKLPVLSLLLVLLGKLLVAQPLPLMDYGNYPFLSLKNNQLIFSSDSSTYQSFVDKLNHLQLEGNNTVKILQIGDSHIQADLFSGTVRELMQQTFSGANGGLELVFPYRVAKTNGSNVYASAGAGLWSAVRNVQKNQGDLGIVGMALTTTDTTASFQLFIRDNNPVVYDFSEVKVLWKRDSTSFSLLVNGLMPDRLDTISETVVGVYRLPHFSDNMVCTVKKTAEHQKQFTLTGILLGQLTPGIIYNNAGVNGAEVRSFLSGNQLPAQLNYLQPDLIIVSLGTNDSYVAGWDKVEFENNLNRFLQLLTRAVPQSAVILTTPADNQRKRRYPNHDLPIVRDIILKVARQNNAIVWDLYSVMGGKNSIQQWLNRGLAARDKVHFTSEGYQLQGKLLFEAILESYSEFNIQRNAN